MISCLLWTFPVIWASTNAQCLDCCFVFLYVIVFILCCTCCGFIFVMCCSGTSINCTLLKRKTYTCGICRFSTTSWVNTWNHKQGKNDLCGVKHFGPFDPHGRMKHGHGILGVDALCVGVEGDDTWSVDCSLEGGIGVEIGSIAPWKCSKRLCLSFSKYAFFTISLSVAVSTHSFSKLHCARSFGKAQLVEQWTFMWQVLGSIPTADSSWLGVVSALHPSVGRLNWVPAKTSGRTALALAVHEM